MYSYYRDTARISNLLRLCVSSLSFKISIYSKTRPDSSSKWASQVVLVVKKTTHLLMQQTQKTWVPSLGQENPLEKGTATLSSILTWRIPWSLAGYSP